MIPVIVNGGGCRCVHDREGNLLSPIVFADFGGGGCFIAHAPLE